MTQSSTRNSTGHMQRDNTDMSSAPLVTYMIATRNRVGELFKTLESCLDQSWSNCEILVVDDASTDGTYDAVRARFPQVEIVRNDANRGSVASRNDILRRARGKFIIALDDDSRFINRDACRRIVERLEAEPDLGIVSFQVVGPEFPERLAEGGRLSGEWHCNSYAACGAAIRRSMLDETGLFPEFFYHSYEEPDLCLRAWDAGYRVLQWNEILVYHEFSPLNRNEQRNHQRHARNEACSVIMRYPWHLVLPGVLVRLRNQFRYARRRGWGWREPRVWLEVLARTPIALWHRRPVSSRALKIWLAVNRDRVTKAGEAWKQGGTAWPQLLRSSPQTFTNDAGSVKDAFGPSDTTIPKSL